MSSLYATLVSFDPDHCIALVNVGNVDLNIPTLKGEYVVNIKYCSYQFKSLMISLSISKKLEFQSDHCNVTQW